MLIRNAEINFSTVTDLRCDEGLVTAIENNLSHRHDEPIIDAHGCALLPGLHDHHLHFLSFAAARASVVCGPPQINSADELIAALQKKVQEIKHSESPWLRGIGYHPSVAGEIDRHWLDHYVPQVPVRIQHRSGRLWILNSLALTLLGDLSATPLEKIGGEFSGRLYDADTWLRERLRGAGPDVRAASAQLAQYGITSFTDTTPHNSTATADYFLQMQNRGELLQDVVLMGDSSLDSLSSHKRLKRGARKVHLHEHDLPDFAELCDLIRASHAVERPVAVHCVTLAELVFTLHAFTHAGSAIGDRIEHASIAPPEEVQQLLDLKLRVVTQPNFIAERGDAYLREVDAVDIPWLYRLQGFLAAGVPLAAGTDAPFGAANPWRAMQAAVTRRTQAGNILGSIESVSPEIALSLFQGDPLLPGAAANRLTVGAVADFCLLDRPWREARENFCAVRVLTTLKDGVVIATI